jgi:hypothetical protein
MWKLILSSLAFAASMILLGLWVARSTQSQNEVIERIGVTINEPQIEEHFSSDAGDAGGDSGVDAGTKNVRPTPEQLAKEYLIWELRDLEKQAITADDKLLVHKALEIKSQRIKDLELSNDFEKNMQKAIK